MIASERVFVVDDFDDDASCATDFLDRTPPSSKHAAAHDTTGLHLRQSHTALVRRSQIAGIGAEPCAFRRPAGLCGNG